MKSMQKTALTLLAGAGIGLSAMSNVYAASTLDSVMKARGLTQKDLLAAAKTYTFSYSSKSIYISTTIETGGLRRIRRRFAAQHGTGLYRYSKSKS